jgi:hypothetical protein
MYNKNANPDGKPTRVSLCQPGLTNQEKLPGCKTRMLTQKVSQPGFCVPTRKFQPGDCPRMYNKDAYPENKSARILFANPEMPARRFRMYNKIAISENKRSRQKARMYMYNSDAIFRGLFSRLFQIAYLGRLLINYSGTFLGNITVHSTVPLLSNTAVRTQPVLYGLYLGNF